MLTLLAIPATLAAAASFAVAAVLEHRSARRVAWQGPAPPRLLVELSRRPLWAAAVVVSLLGVGLQMLALHFGPLTLVQPLLVTSLLFTVVIGALLDGQRPDRMLLAGAGCAAAGLAAFLLAAEPDGGTGVLDSGEALPLLIGLAVAVGACVAVAVRWSGATRALALALACGVVYGVSAAFLKIIMAQFAVGLLEPLRHWHVYVIATAGPLGFLFNQTAFQAGAVPAPVLAVITLTDPLVSIGIGRMWLGEQLASSPWAIGGQVLALGIMAVGVAALAHRAPHISADPAPRVGSLTRATAGWRWERWERWERRLVAPERHRGPAEAECESRGLV